MINGDFRVNQRYAGGTATITGSTSMITIFDRWQFKPANSTQTHLVGPGDAIAPGITGCRIMRNPGSALTSGYNFTHSLTRAQCQWLAGQTATLSVTLRTGSGYTGASSFLFKFLTNNDTSGDYALNGTTGWSGAAFANFFMGSYAPTAGMALTTLTYTSITLPSDLTQMAFQIANGWTGTGSSTDYIEIYDVGIYPGNTAPSTYPRKSFIQNLYDCLPFYQKSWPYSTLPLTSVAATTLPGYSNPGMEIFAPGSNVSAGNYVGEVKLQAVMRATPTVNAYSPNQCLLSQLGSGNGGPQGANTAVPCNISEKSFAINANNAVSSGYGGAWTIHWTSEAELG